MIVFLLLRLLPTFLLSSSASAVLPLSDHPPLRCCTLEAAPFVFNSSRRRANYFDGLTIDYFSLLQERTGLQCKSLQLFTDPESVGWSEFIYNMANCTDNGTIIDDPKCNCDLGVGSWFQSEDRMGVDFLPSHVFAGLNVLTHVKHATTSTGGAFFITSFSLTVWLCIAVLFCLFAFLKLLDTRFAPADFDWDEESGDDSVARRAKSFLLKSAVLFRLRRAVQSTSGRMLGQSLKEIQGDESSTRQWVLNFTIALCGIFLILTYEATMTASLVQERLVSEFEDIDDIRQCRISDDDICFVTGDIIESFWNSTIAPQECRLNGKNGSPHLYRSYESLIEAAVSRECKFVLVDSGTALNYMHGRHCGKLMTTGNTFNIGDLSMVVPKGNKALTEPLAKASLELRGQDALDETLEKYFERKGVCEIVTPPRLDFKKLQLFFILAFATALLIFVEMILDPQTVTGERDERKFVEEKVVG